MRLPIKALKEMASKYGLTHVIIMAHDGKLDHVATYGKTVHQCSQAAEFGNTLKKQLGWPDSLQAQPSRVGKLQEKIKILEARLKRYE